MTTRQKVLIGTGVVILLGSATALSLANRRNRGVEVRMEEVGRRDLVAVVTASGNIRARRSVDISSDLSARVDSLAVQEGDEVEKGQILLRLDRSQILAVRSRAEAALNQANAQAAQTRANLLKARREFNRLQALYQRDSVLVSTQQLETAETTFEVAKANMDAAQYGVEQARASLDEAEDRLSRTVITSPISGRVTRLNVEEGETVIVGTMNNPGSLILTISDLSVVETVVQVDETDVPELTLGDSATVEIDAFPGVTFTGQVTEIGNSAILPPAAQQSSGQQAAIDFEVVITLDPPPVQLRPDLSATAEIVTEERREAVAIPIISLTVREKDDVGLGGEEDGEGSPTTTASAGAPEADDVEGVFVVSDGEVSFRPVRVGVAGADYFEVLSGVQPGDTVVSGPYQVIRELQNGDLVQARDESSQDTE